MSIAKCKGYENYFPSVPSLRLSDIATLALAFPFAMCNTCRMQTLPEKPTVLSDMLGISVPYASQLLGGSREWTRALAIKAYRASGVKIGPIAEATDDEINVLERFEK